MGEYFEIIVDVFKVLGDNFMDQLLWVCYSGCVGKVLFWCCSGVGCIFLCLWLWVVVFGENLLFLYEKVYVGGFGLCLINWVNIWFIIDILFNFLVGEWVVSIVEFGQKYVFLYV